MYTPQPGDVGLGLLSAALRDYLAADPAVLAELPSGAAGIVPEGFMTNDTPTPVVMVSMIGDGQSSYGKDAQLVRYLLHVLDRGRGYQSIERLLWRLRARLNDTEAAMEFLTYAPGTADHTVLHVEAAGSSTSASYPTWQCEGRALYVFVHIAQLPMAV